jgi:hypothetical protein
MYRYWGFSGPGRRHTLPNADLPTGWAGLSSRFLLWCPQPGAGSPLGFLYQRDELPHRLEDGLEDQNAPG